ncbi:hypothetical protein [Neobacillus drentensis]|uniref:hypothetical protein n=1 Tax=Neobacillus drentensis TaxID=220684 RepID=UPI002FFFCD4E
MRIFFNAVLKATVDSLAMLIGAEGARLLREYGAGETPQERSDEEAPRNARGKQSAWSGNQHPCITQTFYKNK